MTFQAFCGPSGAQIEFTVLLATSISDTVTQCTAYDRGAAKAVTLVKMIKGKIRWPIPIPILGLEPGKFQVDWTTAKMQRCWDERIVRIVRKLARMVKLEKITRERNQQQFLEGSVRNGQNKHLILTNGEMKEITTSVEI